MILAVITLCVVLLITPSLSSAENNLVINELDHLLNLLDVPHNKSIQSTTEAAQRWRRKPGQERWEMSDIKLPPEKKEKVMASLTRLDLVHEIKPKAPSYDYAFVLGATAPAMQLRLEYTIHLWRQGTAFQNLIFLVSQRPLTESVDNIEQLVRQAYGGGSLPRTRPNTETEAAKMIWQTSDLPTAMRNSNITFIDTPRSLMDNGEWYRASTRDTVNQWLKQSAPAGSASILVITNQPHAHYQFAVVEQILPPRFTATLAAKAASSTTSLSVYLDALTLWLDNLPPGTLPSIPEQKRAPH